MEAEPVQSELFDVAVVGGGPAGSTVSAFLARRGRRVALIEKDSHPRFHIGESRLPKNLPVLDRLGVGGEIAKIGVYKPGAEFVSPDRDERQVYFFSEAIDPTPDHAYQVLRSDFDRILFQNAVDAGAVTLNRQTVTAFERQSTGWRLTLSGPAGQEEIQARYIVDASGRDGLMARNLNMRRRNREHNSAAIFVHFENVSPKAWQVPGNISVFWFEHGWIWMIPLPDGITSVGAVCMPDYLKNRKTDLETFFDETLQLCPKAWDCLRDAQKVSPVRGAGNYVYSAERPFGDGFLLLGDAYTFVDPVFSTGVLLAMTSGERAAQVIDVILDNPARADRLWRQYQRQLDRAIARVSWFIYRFNAPNLQRLFMGPRNTLGIRNAVMSVLSGDLYRGPFFEWRLAPFKLIYRITSRTNEDTDRSILDRLKILPVISVPEDEATGRT